MLVALIAPAVLAQVRPGAAVRVVWAIRAVGQKSRAGVFVVRIDRAWNTRTRRVLCRVRLIFAGRAVYARVLAGGFRICAEGADRTGVALQLPYSVLVVACRTGRARVVLGRRVDDPGEAKLADWAEGACALVLDVGVLAGSAGCATVLYGRDKTGIARLARARLDANVAMRVVRARVADQVVEVLKVMTFAAAVGDVLVVDIRVVCVAAAVPKRDSSIECCGAVIGVVCVGVFWAVCANRRPSRWFVFAVFTRRTCLAVRARVTSIT